MDHPQIVAGVDGSASSWHALLWAAEHAERTRRDLLVAYLGEGAERLGDYGLGEALAQRIVTTMTREHPAVSVHTVMIDGDPTEFLLRVSGSAAMLVVGREQRPGLVALGQSVVGVLERSTSPVVVSVDPVDDTRYGSRIVLGVSDSSGGRAAALFACDEAVRAGVPVLALRSTAGPEWTLARESPAPPSSTAWQEHEQGLLDDCVAEARSAHPTVVISGFLTGEAVRFALARESPTALLVVLGCGPPAGSIGGRPGPETLIAVHTLPCAIAVVGPRREQATVERSRTSRAEGHGWRHEVRA